MILSSMTGPGFSFNHDDIKVSYFFYQQHRFVLYTHDYKVVCEPTVTTVENSLQVDIVVDFNLYTELDILTHYPNSISFRNVDQVNITRHHSVNGRPQIGIILTEEQPYVIYPRIVIKDRTLVVEFEGQWTTLYNVL